MICGHGQKQKIKIPLPLDRGPYPRAKAIDQIPALCPVSPLPPPPPPHPRRLGIDRCIICSSLFPYDLKQIH